jgi:hypothetical protein
MNRNFNSYQLSTAGATTGWNPRDNDINGVNLYSMTPSQVAVQAGDVDDFKQIVSHPQFQPEMMGDLAVFFNICRETVPERHKVFMEFFNNDFRKNFDFDASRRVFVKRPNKLATLH